MSGMPAACWFALALFACPPAAGAGDERRAAPAPLLAEGPDDPPRLRDGRRPLRTRVPDHPPEATTAVGARDTSPASVAPPVREDVARPPAEVPATDAAPADIPLDIPLLIGGIALLVGLVLGALALLERRARRMEGR